MKGLIPALLVLLAGGTAQDDAFDRTLAALQAGADAASAGDVRHLRRAGADLTASGAVPLDGGDDLGARWTRGSKSRAPAYRDRVLGPGYRSVTVGGSDVWRSEQAFLGGQRARVGIVPTHSGAYRLQILGDDHELVCHASPPHKQCDWVPAYTARFSIEVRNTGSRPEEFLVVIQ